MMRPNICFVLQVEVIARSNRWPASFLELAGDVAGACQSETSKAARRDS
jgi:hypothetical protein